MKKFIPLTLILLDLLHCCFAPPVTKNKGKESNENEEGGLEDYMEYHRYLREVVNALESDPDFRQKLEKAEETDIRSGKIAEELEFVSHHVRTRLDEIKRVELNRLRELTEKKLHLQQNIDNEDPNHRHLDHSNPHTFEIDDLKKLIAKTTEDLAEADRKRREEFKQYELQKEFDKQIKLNHTNGEEEREKLEKEYKEREEKHKKHEKLHEPGHKAQLEEVWQEQDQMQQEFDPKTFFMLHDIDSNGLWDQDEVKALFIKELEKMYAAGEPEDDMRERAEEMERMRESVFKEVDLNKDGFIDFNEFLAQTKRNDFQQDHGWQGLDEKRPYSDLELEEYIRQHQMNQMRYPQHPGAYQQVPPGYHPNGVPMHPGAVPPQQFHPGQGPQHHQPLPGHLPDLNTNEIYPQHRGQPPQGYQQPYQPGQVNYQQHGQPPQGYQPHQPPPQANYQHNQPPPQANYQQQQPPQQVHQQQQQPPPQVQQQQQQPPQQVQQQQPPQQIQQQQPPQQVQQQQSPPQAHQQQQPPQQAINQQPQAPIQSQQPPGNVPQNAPVQGNNVNSNNQGSSQVNQV